MYLFGGARLASQPQLGTGYLDGAATNHQHYTEV